MIIYEKGGRSGCLIIFSPPEANKQGPLSQLYHLAKWNWVTPLNYYRGSLIVLLIGDVIMPLNTTRSGGNSQYILCGSGLKQTSETHGLSLCVLCCCSELRRLQSVLCLDFSMLQVLLT